MTKDNSIASGGVPLQSYLQDYLKKPVILWQLGDEIIRCSQCDKLHVRKKAGVGCYRTKGGWC